MIIQYPKWYKKYGARYIKHILTPKIFYISSLVFPVGTAIHYVNLDDTESYPTRQVGYFSNLPDDVMVRTILKYPNTELEGKYIELPGSPNNIINTIADNERTFYFLKNTQTLNKPARVPWIYNYGSLNSRYRYVAKPLTNMWKYNNGIKTVIDNIDKNKHNMIVINLPLNIEDRLKLIRFLKLKPVNKIRAIPSYKVFNLLEIFKLFIKEEHNNSLFSKIKIEDTKNIDLIFVSGVRCTIVNLHMMLATIKELNLDTKLRSFDWDKANKLWYKFLYNVISTIPLEDDSTDDIEEEQEEDDDEEENTSTTVNKSVISKSIKKEKLKIDKEEQEDNKLIDSFLARYKSIEESEQETKHELDKLEEVDDDIVEDDTDIPIEDNDVELAEEIDTEQLRADIDKLGSKLNRKEASTYKELTTLDELKNDNNLFNKNLVKAQELYDIKAIPKAKYENMLATVQKEYNKVNPITNRKIKDDLDITQDNYNFDQSSLEISSTPMVFSNESNKNTIKTFKKDYITKQYPKDVTRSIFSLTNNNMTIKDFNVVEHNDILGSKQEYIFNLTTFDGKTTKVNIMLPKINTDGTYNLNGNTYLLRSQISDLPIVKIDNNKVELNSYYGKLFIVKASTAANDTSKAILKLLVTNPDIKHLQSGVNDLVDIKLPNIYYTIARYVKYFEKDGYTFTFNYKNRYEVLGKLSVEDIEKYNNKFNQDEVVLIGKHKSYPVVMNKEGSIFEYIDKQYIQIEDLYTLLNIDISELPIEFTTIKILGTSIPLGILISYYIGFNNLLRLLNVEYTEHGPNDRVSTDNKYYTLKFSNVKLRVARDNGQADLLLASFRKYEKIFKDINIESLYDKNTFQIVLSRLQLPSNVLTEIELLENMFIDPMTYTTLKELNEPTSFKGLLIRANELLINDYYTNPDDIDKSTVKGYERIPGLVYLKLIQALKKYENANKYGKAKFGLSSYDVINSIMEDSTSVSVDDNNPIAYIKQIEDTTKLGEGGRSKLTMSANTRVINSSEIGIISEATKDSGDVGITAIMAANPKLTNTKGMVSELTNQDDWSSIISTCAMISPFGLTDDTKRLNFASIMQSHVIPIENMRTPYVLTGYEAIIPLKCNDKFCISAEDNGTVISVGKDNIVVNYEKLGKKKYDFHNWTSKEETGTCYEHILVPNLQPNEKFVKDDTLVYNKTYFSPCIFYPRRVIYKQGEMVNTVLAENLETFEDSVAMSSTITKRLSAKIVKVLDVILDFEDNIELLANVNDTIKAGDILLTSYTGFIDKDQIDKETLKLLTDLNRKNIKSKVNGTISKIEVRYHGDISNMSKTIKNLVKISDEDSLKRTGYTGKVDGSYSVKGSRLQENTIHIKYYINTSDDMGIGDKAVLCNQCKFTVGEVYENPITTEDGTPVEMMFAARGIAARIVNSAFLVSTTSMVLEKLTEKALDIYFSK